MHPPVSYTHLITTDTDIHPELLDRALHDAVNVSFNMLSVDGDTSTNDMVSIMASGTAQNKKINDFGDGYIAFSTALTALCTEMVKMMAKDGEGATKLVMCKVSGATTEETAVSYTHLKYVLNFQNKYNYVYTNYFLARTFTISPINATCSPPSGYIALPNSLSVKLSIEDVYKRQKIYQNQMKLVKIID